jgi:hypothetical protein
MSTDEMQKQLDELRRRVEELERRPVYYPMPMLAPSWPYNPVSPFGPPYVVWASDKTSGKP